jgi:four helix bundle protein
VKNFRDLKVWGKAHELATRLYQATAHFPAEEKFGLTAQLRRAAVSIPANIAEGCGRSSDRDLGRFLQMSLGSASELEYELLLAHELGFLDGALHQELTERTTEVKRMLASLIKKLDSGADR